MLTSDDPTPPQGRRKSVIHGRHGSPTITIAFPFSRVEVEANDQALDALADLADLIGEVAEASASEPGVERSADLRRLATRARTIGERLRAHDDGANEASGAET